MVAENVEEHHDGVTLHLLSSVAASVCVVAIVVLFISKLFSGLSSCCRDLFASSKDNQNGSGDVNENKYEFLKKSSQPKYEPLKTNNANLKRPISMSLESLDSYKHAMFAIPGMMVSLPIQPAEGSTTSGYSTTSYAESVDGSVDGSRVFLDEFVQPSEKELPGAGVHTHRLTPVRPMRKSWAHSDSIDMDSVEQFNPELYEIKSRRTHGAGSLGKVNFSLQYEDKTKRKLIMTLHELVNLQYIRGTEQVVSLYITAMLIPERDYRFQSKQLMRDTKITLDEVFTFHSRPHNRDFEARTIHLTVVYVEKSSKEITYGESRMPLLSHEIYSQVPTEMSTGIKPFPANAEIGDAQVVLSYSSLQKKLNVMVKCVRVAQTNLLDHLTGLHIKAHLVRVGGDRLGKKRSVSKSLANTATNLIDFQDHMTFDLEPENYMLCTLKLHIHGKHKIMGKHLSLGKMRIGDSNNDDGGKVHWKTVLNSEGIGWTMWHPIYNA